MSYYKVNRDDDGVARSLTEINEVPQWEDDKYVLPALERFDQLSNDERAVLAHTARTRAQLQDDPRYWNIVSNDERAELRRRWNEIADALQP